MGVLRRGLTVDGSVRHVVYYGLTLLGLLWASSCGDETSPAAPNPTQAVANGSPSTSGAIPGQALTVEQVPSTMDVAPYFVDPDGDMLTYAAVSSDVGVMSASISGSTLTLTPVGAGAAMVSVQATDPGGLTATQQIAVTVKEPAAQSAPDLLVESPSVDDSSPETGGWFTLSATVWNDGDGTSPATTLRYYRSTDATITSSDTEVGTDAVGPLSASETSEESIDLTASATAGTYYYGACVDAVTDESDASNNCSGSVQVDVEEPVYPDLEVGSPSVNDNSPETGGSFTLSVPVTNSGDAEAAATTLRYYRSTDATITTGDTSVGTDAVGALAAGADGDESIDLTAPSTAGTYYYGACVEAVAGESDTTNNCSAAVPVDVEEPVYPDLEVGTPSVNDSSPETGGSFTLSATVTNVGDGESPATTLRYYRSTDATITTSDTQVGTGTVGVLSASGTSAESIDLTAPSTAGRYYYGACVDSVTDESDTADNCSGSAQVDVEEPAAQSAPDLLVGAPSVNDGSLETGGSFTLSAAVTNAGDRESPATTLRYYRSTDATITASDTQVGTDAVGVLSVLGTSAESIDLTAPSTAGTYYYGACVEAVSGESDTTNNCSAAVQVDVEDPVYPDLQVESPSVNDGSPETGGSFTLSATVTNAGDGESPATTLRYYRSADATITASDTQVGTDAVGVLAASGTSAESIDLAAPSTPGRYYYGACVDAVTDESDTTDNCSGSVQVDVEEPVYPDLEVGSPSVDDSSPETGGSFTLSATVTNGGDRESPATTLRYYRSTDATISSSDTEVGTDAVGALSASGTSAESIDLTAPSTAGRYYYGACVEAVSGESDTTNNCSAAVPVDVEEPVYPDLEVGTPSVNDSSLETGGSFTLSATVTNVGDGESPATTLRYYRSADATITTSDTQVGTGTVGVLSASGTSAESIDLTAPSTAGRYYYGACVDSVTDESDTADNCSGSAQVDVEEPAAQSAPDLLVGAPSVNDGSLETGGSFTLSAAVTNAGDRESPATTLRYYRSTDATITASDTQVGTDAVGVLSVLGTSAESIDLTAPSTAGTYYYGACVEAVSGESDTTNNCSAAVQVDVEDPVYPDLQVESPSVNDGSPETGGSFTLSATVTNAGDGESPATTLRYYRSADATITASDTQVGTDAVGVLAASGTSAESIDLAAPSTPGRYYYGACVDAVTDESDTTDNCSGSVQVDVEEPVYPDLEVGSPSVDDSSPETGGSFTLSATVTNGGDRESPATTLRYYRSTDATISSSDTEVGTDAVGALSASGTSAESIDLTAPSTAGRYYYGACVEAVSGESDTTNNCSAAVPVDVEEPVYPDLEVGTPSVNDSSLETGGSFTLSATVTNVGDGESPATTLRYYRSADATITTSDTQVGTDAVGVLSASGTSAESIDLTAPSTAGRYYYGACVDSVTDESDTADNCSGSAQVDVEEPAAQSAPDLLVGAPSVNDGSLETGGSFTLSAAVTNAGDRESPATTLRYYRSTDATITASDTQVGTDAVGVLSVLGTSAESIDLTAPSTAGTYYYGACVEAVSGESDTTNNCSAAVQVDVEDPVYPDLQVESPSVNDGSPETGGSFTLSATVTNAGDGESPATTLRYYRSADATITASDTQVGTDAVGVLAASGTSAESIDLAAPSTPGRYYYGACVDAVTDESDTTDNCSGSVQVDVEEPVYPDLEVGSPSVDDSSPETGGSFTLSATVTNGGDRESPATTLRYYRSTDATISSSDTEVGTDAVGALSASGTSAESIDLTAPSTAGRYYYGACVEAVSGESDTTNNCSAAVPVDVEEPVYPDLEVGTPSVNDSSLETGGSFTLSATVTNVGDGESPATTLRYYRSADATITTSDTQVGTDAVGVLSASGTSAESIDLTAPSTAGRYYYGACVDSVTDESDTTNNCSTSVQVDVETPQPQQTPASVEVTAPQEWAPVGETVTYTARVLDSEGEEIDGAKVSWSSSDTDIATVDENGVVTAVAVGEATVMASTSASVSGSPAASTAPLPRAFSANAPNAEMSVSGSLKMDVVTPVARIELDPSSLSFDEVGGTQTLTATLYDADDNEMSPTYWGWSSADREVAAVNGLFSEGVSVTVQATGEGTTTVTLSANGTKESANVTVTITGRQVDISPGSLTFTALGDTKAVTVRALDENGAEDADATFSFIGIFSPCCGPDARNYLGGTSTRKVDGGLEVTARGPGRGQITINSQYAESAILPITVYMAPASLEISPDLVTLAVDGTTTLRATVKDANGNSTHVDEGDGRGGRHVYWETSDSEVATVETTSGSATATVTAIKAGTATITGRWGSTITGTATVTVTESN